MVFPRNFETKIGFNEVRTAIRGRCLSSLGAEMADQIAFHNDSEVINELLEQVREFHRIMEDEEEFPEENFLDMRSNLVRIQLKGSYLDESELYALKTSLTTISHIIKFLDTGNADSDEEKDIKYPSLHKLTRNIAVFPSIIERIERVLNKFGKIKDDASPELLKIRTSINNTKKSITISLRSILHNAQQNGYAPEDASPTIRDGRLVIPIFTSLKRKINGIVHTESATGKTVFMEPSEVVEANNNIRTLEAAELRAVIAILQEISDFIRPEIESILDSYRFLGIIDLIPLVIESLRRRNKKMIPLDITLTPENRILLISGPNAGGKSVTLTTTGLLQYMLQCGISIPVAESSRVGIFKSIFLDIGDEQSIEDELSTYSGHLYNMKNMMRSSDADSLILIDEIGGGTEPQIGAAIAQAMLHRFLTNQTWGIITTHYQSLKYFAQENEGIVNGAMLYDRAEMQPLFQLQIGMPGSSFAIEIAFVYWADIIKHHCDVSA